MSNIVQLLVCLSNNDVMSILTAYMYSGQRLSMRPMMTQLDTLNGCLTGHLIRNTQTVRSVHVSSHPSIDVTIAESVDIVYVPRAVQSTCITTLKHMDDKSEYVSNATIRESYT